LSRFTGLQPVLTSARTSIIPIRVDVPEKIGADRIANAVAAARLYPLPAIVMDVGTATTVSVIDATGSLVGGSISLGLQNSARALHQVTAQLPLSDLASPPAQIGATRRTASAAAFSTAQLRCSKALQTGCLVSWGVLPL